MIAAAKTSCPMIPDNSSAALWLATTRRAPGFNSVVELRQRFGLSAPQACEAIREAALIRAGSL